MMPGTLMAQAASPTINFTFTYQGGTLNGQTPNGGLAPNATIVLYAELLADGSPCGNYELFNTFAHAKNGDLKNVEYLEPGSGDVATMQFDSGTYGQRNIYWPIFYCWTNSNPEVALRSGARTWTSVQRFDQTTVKQERNNPPPTGRTTTKEVNVKFGPLTQSKNLIDLVNAVYDQLFKVVIPIAIVIILYAGATLLWSQGNPEIVKRGKGILKWAVIGLAVVTIGKGFFTFIQSILDLAK